MAIEKRMTKQGHLGTYIKDAGNNFSTDTNSLGSDLQIRAFQGDLYPPQCRSLALQWLLDVKTRGQCSSPGAEPLYVADIPTVFTNRPTLLIPLKGLDHSNWLQAGGHSAQI